MNGYPARQFFRIRIRMMFNNILGVFLKTFIFFYFKDEEIEDVGM